MNVDYFIDFNNCWIYYEKVIIGVNFCGFRLIDLCFCLYYKCEMKFNLLWI